MNLLKIALLVNLCLLAACQEPATSSAADEGHAAAPEANAASKQNPPGAVSLVGQSSKCPPGSAPFNLAPWLDADIAIACGLRSGRKYVTKAGVARFQITYEYTAGTAQEELDALGNALKAAGFSERPVAGAQATQRIYFKKGHDSVNVWANPERKSDFKSPEANGAIGIDMSDVATVASTASAN
jgi:hypothetical protein